jgi:hypothetical protein
VGNTRELQEDNLFATLKRFYYAVELHVKQFHHCADVTADVTQRGKKQLSFPHVFRGNPEKWMPD